MFWFTRTILQYLFLIFSGSHKSDIFALGITMMEMMIRINPYFLQIYHLRPGQPRPSERELRLRFDVTLLDTSSQFHLDWSIRNADKFYSPELRSIVESMVQYVWTLSPSVLLFTGTLTLFSFFSNFSLIKDPDKRPDASELLALPILQETAQTHQLSDDVEIPRMFVFLLNNHIHPWSLSLSISIYLYIYISINIYLYLSLPFSLSLSLHCPFSSDLVQQQRDSGAVDDGEPQTQTSGWESPSRSSSTAPDLSKRRWEKTTINNGYSKPNHNSHWEESILLWGTLDRSWLSSSDTLLTPIHAWSPHNIQ